MSGFAEGVPTVGIRLGGQGYDLAWTNGAKRRYNDWLTSHGIDPKATDTLAMNMGVVIWASMDKDARTSLSVEDVEEMIHPGNEGEIVERFGALFTKSEPDPDPNVQPGAVKKPTPGTSSIESGPLASTI